MGEDGSNLSTVGGNDFIWDVFVGIIQGFIHLEEGLDVRNVCGDGTL